MTNSTIFIEDKFIRSESGVALKINKSGLISNEAVTNPAGGPEQSALSLSNYNQTTPNILLNGDFGTGDLTDWSQIGTNSIVGGGSYPGVLNYCSIGNLSSISQTVSGFQDKSPVLNFSHKGYEVYVSIELLTSGDVLVGSLNRVFPYSEDWVDCTTGVYSGQSTATKCRITFYSDNNSALVTKISLQNVYGYAGILIGDSYNETRDSISLSARKFFFGNSGEVLSSRPEGFDIRTDMFVKGDINLIGSLNANLVFPQIGLQPFASNMIISSANNTTISWTSALVQMLSTQVFGISAGSQTISTLTYFYIDTDISETILQYSTLYSDAIGNNKVVLFSASPTSGDRCTFQSFSGQVNTPTKLSDLSSDLGNVTFANQTISLNQNGETISGTGVLFEFNNGGGSLGCFEIMPTGGVVFLTLGTAFYQTVVDYNFNSGVFGSGWNINSGTPSFSTSQPISGSSYSMLLDLDNEGIISDYFNIDALYQVVLDFWLFDTASRAIDFSIEYFDSSNVSLGTKNHQFLFVGDSTSKKFLYMFDGYPPTTTTKGKLTISTNGSGGTNSIFLQQVKIVQGNGTMITNNTMYGNIKIQDELDCVGNAIFESDIQNTGRITTSSISLSVPRTITSSDTILPTDSYIIMNTVSPASLTFPSAASYPGMRVVIKNTSAYLISSPSMNIAPLSGGSPSTFILGAAAGLWVELVSDGVSSWVAMSGN